MGYVILGKEVATGLTLALGDIERRPGLYILGKPGMGKSVLMVNIMCQDLVNGQSVFFLDPHKEAITDFINRFEIDFTKPVDDLFYTSFLLFDPAYETHTFGINLLSCRNTASLTEREDTYARAYNVFAKIWPEKDFGPWLQLILQNVLRAFIENQEYTLAEVPMFLNPRNTAFREHILSNIKHRPEVADFWRYEFFERREQNQQERVDAALTRINTLLTNPYVKHIIGQQKTTLDFTDFLNRPVCILVRLSATLPPDSKKFLGTILISELVHAVRKRPEGERNQFCIFVDEFQNFTSDQDFTTLLTEARKFGIATTIAHVERSGQFSENPKLIGATLAAVNKVFFQLTVPDASELAPEFAKEPTTTETRLEPELVISQEPVNDLLRRGHANPRIQEIVNKWFRPILEKIERLRDAIEGVRVERTDYLDQAAVFNDQASLDRLDEQSERVTQSPGQGYQAAQYGRLDALQGAMTAIENAMSLHSQAKDITRQMQADFHKYQNIQQRLRSINRFLSLLMDGRIALVPGQEIYAKFFIDFIECQYIGFSKMEDSVYILSILLRFGDPKLPRTIPGILAMKYFPQELEAFYMQERRAEREGFEEGMRYDLKKYREIITQSNYYRLPDLPPHIFTAQKRETLLEICRSEVLSDPHTSIRKKDNFPLIDDLIDLCHLLQKPENHIKIPSGQYVAKPINIRPVHDMTNEMAQELMKLPRYTAYAKIIEEKEGVQTVKERRIETYPLPELPDKPKEYFEQIREVFETNPIRSGYAISREEIEVAIRLRQSQWLGSSTPPQGRVKKS